MNIDLAYIDEMNLNESYENDFNNIIEETLNHLNIKEDIEISVIIVNDEKIHEINREYRKIDRSTDVISFALEDSEQYYMEGMPRELGDIFISIDHAIKQSKEYEHSLKREMCFLFLHGLLHLLGYDHMEKDEEKIMFDLQKVILDKLNIKRG